jgi:hypothetical protein
MTHPDDNRPPPKEPLRGHHHDDQHRADARAVPTDAPSTGGSTGDGPQGAEGNGSQDTPRETTGRKLPAPVLAL